MNKYLFCFMLTVAFLLLSCSDDDHAEKTVFQAKDIEGAWFCLENATFLNISNTSFHGSVFTIQEEIPTTGENLTGTWTYYPSNNILRMRVEYEKSKIVETRDYKIIKVEENRLDLIDLELNTLYTYYRVVDNRIIPIGESFKVNAGDFTPSSYSVINTAIADVDIRGNVFTKTAGTTFVCASSELEKVYARVDVLRIPYYQKELFSTIDMVLKKYGKPDYSGYFNTANISNMGVRYNTKSTIRDKGLQEIVYIYDEITKEITIITMVYKEGVSFSEDMSYIKQHFYDVFKDGTTYGIEPGMSQNEFNILSIRSKYDEIRYVNQIYLRKNKHY